MNLDGLPPEVIEKRDDERAVFLLLNALRRKVTKLSAVTSGIKFSSALGRGDASSTTSGNEDIIYEFELPSVFAAFTFGISCQLLSASGAATVRARLGGTWSTVDGNVIATMSGSTPTFSRVETSATVAANTGTLLKVTLKSSAPTVKASFAGGWVLGS